MTMFAFQPQGTTKLIAATSSTASTPTQVSTGSQQCMFVVNASTASLPVYLAFGSSSVQAACPTTAVPATGLCLEPGQGQSFFVPPAGWLSAATSAGSASVFATPGAIGT